MCADWNVQGSQDLRNPAGCVTQIQTHVRKFRFEQQKRIKFTFHLIATIWTHDICFSLPLRWNLRLAAVFKLSLFIFSRRQWWMYLTGSNGRTAHSLNSSIKAVWNGMFKLYWCHIHDRHDSQEQQPLTTRTQHTEKKTFCLSVSLLLPAQQCTTLEFICAEECKVVMGMCWDKKLSNKYKMRGIKVRLKQEAERMWRAGEIAQRQKACRTSSYFNTPTSITTHTNHSPQRPVTQLRVSHQLFVTSAEDEDGDMGREGKKEEIVYWKDFGEE